MRLFKMFKRKQSPKPVEPDNLSYAIGALMGIRYDSRAGNFTLEDVRGWLGELSKRRVGAYRRAQLMPEQRKFLLWLYNDMRDVLKIDKNEAFMHRLLEVITELKELE